MALCVAWGGGRVTMAHTRTWCHTWDVTDWLLLSQPAFRQSRCVHPAPPPCATTLISTHKRTDAVGQCPSHNGPRRGRFVLRPCLRCLLRLACAGMGRLPLVVQRG